MKNEPKEEPRSKGKEFNKGLVGFSVVAAVVTMLGTNFHFFNFGSDTDPAPARLRDASPPPNVSHFITDRTQALIYDLNGSWKFNTGDDLSWATADFDDTGWVEIEAPRRWERSGFKDYDGFAWYRRSFDLGDLDPNKRLYLRLGQIDDVDETYINGQKVGGLGHVSPYSTAWEWERIYSIPSGLLKANGNNTIAIRVYDAELDGGIVRGELGIFASTVPDPLIDLSGSWKFQTGDDLAWKEPGADETEFSSTYVPMAWESQGFLRYDGTAWYRKSFALSEPPAVGTYILILGMIDDRDEAFLNGTRVGFTDQPEDAESPYNIVRAYPFDAELLKAENTISVRVHDDGGIGGIFRGPIGIMEAEAYEIFVEQSNNANQPSFRRTVDWLLGK